MEHKAIPILTVLLLASLAINIVFSAVFWLSFLLAALLALAVYDRFQSKHSILRNFPLVGRGRWIIESMRPFIQQYILE